MNVLGFGPSTVCVNRTNTDENFDANFISIYNPELDEFEYFVERLCGISIQNAEMPKESPFLWHVYINGALYDWTSICRYGKVIEPSDHIEWKLH